MRAESLELEEWGRKLPSLARYEILHTGRRARERAVELGNLRREPNGWRALLREVLG